MGIHIHTKMGQWKKTMDRESAHTGGAFRREKDEIEVKTESTILNFGKYRGKEIEEVYNIDVQYCKWLYCQGYLIDECPGIKKFLHDELEGTDLTYVMTWGRFKGKTLAWIQTKNPAYLEWLLKNEFVNSNCPKLKEELKKLMEIS